MRTLKRQATRGGGFTLVELLVAMVILQVGILSLVAVIPLAQVQVANAEGESQATQLVREQLENLGRLAYSDSLLVAGGPYGDPQNPIAGRFTRTWTVADDQPISGCKSITVQVAWSNPRGTRQIQASTVKASY